LVFFFNRIKGYKKDLSKDKFFFSTASKGIKKINRKVGLFFSTEKSVFFFYCKMPRTL